MAVQLVGAKRVLLRTLSKGRYSKMTSSALVDVPKGHFAVYVGMTWKKRMVIPVSYLNHPLFRELLQEVEEEFGYEHAMGGITIPCTENYFRNLISMIHN